MGIRYVLQLMVMLGDVVFFLATIVLAIFAFESIQNLIVFPVLLFLGFQAFKSWKTLGFVAWRPGNIKKFMANAKKAGL